jgi:hypothetical protein
MWRRLGVGAGLAGLGVLAWLASSQWVTAEPPSSRDPRAEDSRPAAVRKAQPTAESREEGLVIRGTVSGPKGPVAGAVVRASRAVEGETLSELPCGNGSGTLLECAGGSQGRRVSELVSERRGEALVLAQAVTAEDGAFTLTGVAAGRYALWVESPEGVGFQNEVAAGTEQVGLRVGAGVRLSGTVVDNTKAPVPRALVTAIFIPHSRLFETLADDEGRFHLGPLPAGGWVLFASKEGLQSSVRTFTAYRAEETTTLRLDRPRGLTGRVLLRGNPVAGVEVRTRAFGRERSALTDQEGRFSLEGLHPRYCTLEAWSGAYGVIEEVEFEAEGTEITLELEPVGVLEGVIRDETGQPIENAKVKLSLKGASWSEATVARTDGAGRYLLGPLIPGEYLFEIDAHTYQALKEVPVSLEAGELRRDFTLKRAVRITGTLVDSEGQPVRRERLELFPIAQGEDSRTDISYTGSGGHFALEAPAAGTYRLTLGGSTVRAQERVVTAPTDGLQLIAERLPRVMGEVVDEAGTPLPLVSVALWSAAPSGEEERVDVASTDIRGRFELSARQAGSYWLVAELSEAELVRATSQRVELGARGEVRVRLAFEPSRSLSGVVVDRRGAPLEDAAVLLTAAPRNANPGGDGGKRRSVSTGPDGRFTFQQVSGEQFDLYVWMTGYVLNPRSVSGPVRIQRDVQDLRIVMIQETFIEGRVVHADGSPVTRFQVSGKEFVDGEGRFFLRNPGPGVRELEVSAPGLVTVRRTVSLQEEEDLELGLIVLEAARGHAP